MVKSDVIRFLSAHSKTERLIPFFLNKRFSGRDTIKVAVYYQENRISFSQIFPFIYYAHEFLQRFNAEFAYIPTDSVVEDDNALLPGADIAILQVWFDVDRDKLRSLLHRIKRKSPGCSVAFFDSFAPADLRLAATLGDDISYYVKKSILKDHSIYARATRGDTHLEEYYSKLYDLTPDMVSWNVPPGFLQKVRLGPNFFTAPFFLSEFDNDALPDFEARRQVDLHARLGSREEGWYGLMRKSAIRAVDKLDGSIDAVSGFGVSRKHFMSEMSASKICFSPFGHGELCWRDVEAMLSGSLLLKPDMSHLETAPDIYVPYETYAPLRWDFSDLQDVVDRWLRDDNERLRVTQNAYALISDYVRERRFLDQMAFLFEPCEA